MRTQDIMVSFLSSQILLQVEQQKTQIIKLPNLNVKWKYQNYIRCKFIVIATHSEINQVACNKAPAISFYNCGRCLVTVSD